jgi:hypothetical protein
MSDFRMKLFGLAALGAVFAGMSYGQSLNCAGGSTQTLSPLQPILIRAESEADLASDVVVTCLNNSVAISNGTLSVFASLPITSKAAAAAGLSGTPGNSEAILTVYIGGTVNSATGGIVGAASATQYQGTVTGSQATFNGISFPVVPVLYMQVSNIRVNAASAPVGATPVAVTEQVFVGSFGLAAIGFPQVTTGYEVKSLVAPAFVTPPGVKSYVVCVGNPASAFATPSLSFVVAVAETYGGFFKTQTGGGVVQNGEQGSMQLGALGTAASGTGISLTFANVPSVATIYVPTTVTYTGTAGATATLSLPVGTAAVTSPPGLLAASGVYSYPSGYAAYTPSSGSITVTYTVAASSAAQVENFQIPVYVAFAANSAAPQGPITVLEAYAPAIALAAGTLPTTIPIFAPTTNTPLNASAISVCQTNLLFPFLTNQLGFDTGIVLANTSTDPLGFIPGTSAATPQGGACTLNFYGAGAPTPSSVAAPGGVQATATTNAFLLSSVAPGFQGYMIAVCNYLYGHGYAFIAYDLTQNNGAVEGYLAEVILNGSRPVGTAGEALGE